MRTLLSMARLAVLVSALPLTALAGAVIDSDFDLVPDQFDNCRIVANGPNQTTNQVDADLDGYGNRCDADYDQSGTTTVADFAFYLSCFGAIGPFSGSTADCDVTDHDGSDTITTSDFAIFLGKFSASGASNSPGPSGLVCADPTIQVDLGQTPCVP